MNFFIRFLLSGLVLLLIDWLFDSISIDSYGSALIAVFMLWIVNFFVKPILHLLTFPITILTFGLFSFVINALTFTLASLLVRGFEVTSFWGALVGSILLGFAQSWLEKKK
ncbi:phage holin family protein [Peribacillus loiseleuriae]|uniref:Membrane protein n=1 Tax=Peribacillus loiseleuriae TaxID=1679170 RepID=A0A0K9GYH6_9BACI|nr:phage holin family protein [Peribacillus loiseleuriae]KMY51651.1 membrane protein [Peribacillus loiseleuriae]